MADLDALMGADALPVFVIVMAMASLLYQSIRFSLAVFGAPGYRVYRFPVMWWLRRFKQWRQLSWAAVVHSTRRQLGLTQDHLLASYLLTQGFKSLYPTRYRASSLIFLGALVVESVFLLCITLTLFNLEGALLQSLDQHPYSQLLVGRSNGMGMLWVLYCTPVFIYLLYLASQIAERVSVTNAITGRVRHATVSQGNPVAPVTQRVQGSNGIGLSNWLQDIYTYPPTFLLLILTLYCTLLMTLLHILVPLSTPALVDSQDQELSRYLFTGFMASSLMIFTTWTKHLDSLWLFERCKLVVFHPLLSCLLLGMLFCVGYIVFEQDRSLTLSVVALILVVFLFLVQLVYRSQIYSVGIQSVKAGLYLCVVLALVYSCIASFAGYTMTTGTVIGQAIVTVLVAAVFTGVWHYRWNAPRESLRQERVLQELDSRKQGLLFDYVTKGDQLGVAGLLSMGINPASKDKKGDFLMHIAVKNGHKAMIRTLQSFGADINAANKLGLTPIHIAASHVNFEILQALLDSGANPHVKDMHGKTPLHRLCSQSRVIAGELQQRKLVQELLEQGLNPLEKDSLGKSAYDLAKKWNANEIAELMTKYMDR